MIDRDACGLISKVAWLAEWEWHERNLWPFLTVEQLQEARRHPWLFAGGWSGWNKPLLTTVNNALEL